MTTRRDALRGFAALAASLTLAPDAVWAQAKSTKHAPDPLLVRLCDLVIPTTDTPGAVKAGVPAFVATALQHGMKDGSPAMLVEFAAALDARAAGRFVALPHEHAFALLAEVDAAAYARPAPGAPPSPPADDAVKHWRSLKQLIVLGYYTSEIGGSQELQYEPVPSTFEPDIPLSTNPRAYSSDWVGVKYA